ncbi:MAG: PAS domain S-box protein [Planctomycetes bacterium]|nr:PAS domain S-box protein [Planctomycetota bacterium]
MNSLNGAELAQALFDDSSDALFLVDVESARIVQANDAAARLTGRNSESLPGTALIELLHSQQAGEFDELTRCLDSGTRFHAPDGFELITSHGDDLIPIELTLRPLRTGQRALLQVKDSRSRRQLEERTALAETELALVLNTVPAAVWCAEREPETTLAGPCEELRGWRYRYLSHATERVVGWPLEFFNDGPHRFAQIIHPDDRNAVLTERTTFLLSPETFFSMELRVIGQDGLERWIRSDMQATRDSHGRAVRLDGVVTDIRRSKVAELSLRESQHWLTRLLQTNTNGVLILDLTGCITYVNPAAELLLGRRSDELLDRDWNQLPWHSDDNRHENVQELVYQTLASSELTLDRPDGNTVTVALSAAPFRNDAGLITGVVVTLFDLTQRKRAEETIRRSEERYRRLFERNLAGVCRYTSDGRCLDANPAYASVFGFDTPAEMLNVPSSELYFSPEEREEKIKRLFAQGQLTNIETRRRRKDGKEVWVLENVMLVQEGSATIIEATVVDITERKHAEQKLANEHALLQALLNSIPDFIFYKDREGRYQGCNPAFEEYSTFRQSDIVDRKIEDLFPSEQAMVMAREDRQVYDSGKPLRLEKTLETGLGSRSVELVLNPLMTENGEILGLLGIGRDITERLRLEEQLRQTGKMEAIGRLAGGVAHDFNNLLTIIIGNLALSRSLLADNDAARELLTDSEQAAQRAAELTNQLLGFSRRHPLAVQPLDLNRRVTETVQLLRRTIDPRIQIEAALATDLWTIEADGGQMSQVLMNLCLNARDAIADGGHIRLETTNVHMTQVDVGRNLDARAGDFIRIRLSDDGPGISPELQARIFEPFFTTKPFGKGTGLGLAVVFGIVRQHQGWIECHSELGRGTRFDIYLPRSTKTISHQPSVPSNLPVAGTETILLADDEPMIRELARAVLSKQGYQLILAEDGVVAVELYREHGERIDLVLLDLSMPNLSGREAMRQIRDINPRARILFASGYSTDQFEPGELDGVLGFIPKPYRPQDLTRAIRSALDNTSSGGKIMVLAPERLPV